MFRVSNITLDHVLPLPFRGLGSFLKSSNDRSHSRPQSPIPRRARNGALCRQALWEPLEVAAVVVDHVVLLHPLHLLLAPPPAAAAGDSVGPEASIRGGERRLRPVGLDQAASGSPVIRVPEAGVDSHGLVLGERDAPRFQVLEVSDRGAVDHEAAEERRRQECEIGIVDDGRMVGVGVEVRGGIKPELELHLPVPLPLGEHVGVEGVGISADISEPFARTTASSDTLSLQKIHNKGRRECPMRRAYIVGSDGAGGVPGNELDLHVDLAEEVLVLGLESRARGPVEGEGEELAALEDLGAGFALGDGELLVEVAGGGDGQQRGSYQQKPHRHCEQQAVCKRSGERGDRDEERSCL
ncbi:hypothetical protein B296_00035561 [Ensete ventricosum]|uniref:Uncharacterized protein n=1 Tax=Ensete ventricosum TaxID=4639 RepID=A0A426Y063_ENSVE|nr:hypothetical protein B296_00035561 [Ensete ventricosum]